MTNSKQNKKKGNNIKDSATSPKVKTTDSATAQQVKRKRPKTKKERQQSKADTRHKDNAQSAKNSKHSSPLGLQCLLFFLVACLLRERERGHHAHTKTKTCRVLHCIVLFWVGEY